jgi:long-chain acyl-CoA synthetase
MIDADVNLAGDLVRSARRWPGRLAVIEVDRVELSYAALARRALALADGLRSRLGVEPGDRVGLVLRNSAAYVELLYACWAAGAAVVPVNVKLHPREVAFVLDDAGAAVCFVTDDVDAAATEAARTAGATTFVDVDTREYDELIRGTGPAELPPTAAGDVAWLFYTSGTTGRPKGVMLTHRNLRAMIESYLADVDVAVPGDHLLHAAPMSHGSGLYVLPNVVAGSTQLIPASRGFDVTEIDELLERIPAVKLFAAPTMVMRLVDGLQGDARGLKTVVYGGGPMYVADCLRALDRLGPRLTQIYGQGEAPMTITVLPAADHLGARDDRLLRRLGSVGRAQTGVELAILDAGDRPLSAGEVGEVAVRGAVVMEGYLNDPEATARTLAHGWLHTGDLGRIDGDGYLTLVDRSKELIVSGGSNIYPREIEEVLLRHPAVREVAVIGVPDAEWGEAAVAVIVAASTAPVPEAELDALCLDHIARFKRPKRYVLVDQLPKSPAGKVLKRDLRAQLERRAGSG